MGGPRRPRGQRVLPAPAASRRACGGDPLTSLGPTRAERARAFGAAAADYDRYRPGPPVEAVSWVLPAAPTRVLDLGAGTGGLTRTLVGLVPVVAALEPDPRMRAVLAAGVPAAHLVAGVGERLPFATGGLDAVVASSSWHWVDPALGWPEIARVLRPGGVFGRLWSGPDRSVPWVSEVLARRPRTARAGPRRRTGRFGRPSTAAAGLPFGVPEAKVARFGLSMDEDDLAGLSGTYSGAILSGSSDRSAVMAAVRARARAALGAGRAEVPMTCRAFRVVRLPDPEGAPGTVA